jgi:O-antigen/teichoic acid export membrane protein
MAADASQAPALAAAAARRLAALVLGLVIVLAVGADPIASTLFGDAYAAAGPAIAILAWIALFAVTGGIALHAIVACNAERLLLPANVVAAILGVALQVVLIRALGLQGAALATVATAAIGQLALTIPTATRAVMVPVWRAVLPLVGLAVAAVSAGRYLQPSLVGAIAAAGVYVILAGTLGLVGRDDWRVMRAALARPRIG